MCPEGHTAISAEGAVRATDQTGERAKRCQPAKDPWPQAMLPNGSNLYILFMFNIFKIIFKHKYANIKRARRKIRKTQAINSINESAKTFAEEAR